MGSSADRAASPTRHVALFAVAVIFVAPLVWMLITSLKSQSQVFTWPPVLVPHPLDWGNYSQALIGASFLRYLGNTAALSVVVAAGNLISATLVAYSLARVDWKWRNAAFLVVLSTLLLPDTVTIVPLYSLFRKLGMVGGIQGFLPLILPSWFGKAYFIFMLRQFMLGIPGELSHATACRRRGGDQDPVVDHPTAVPTGSAVGHAFFAYLYLERLSATACVPDEP